MTPIEYNGSFQHSSLKLAVLAVQPNYRTWQRIELGMSRDEVINILGEPPTHSLLHQDDNYLHFGFLQLPVLHHPLRYLFTVGFKQDRVWYKQDPFGGNFSLDGLPCRPRIVTPREGHVFLADDPRWIYADVRWHPVAGVYPMTYELEVSVAPPETNGEMMVRELARAIPIPFFIITLNGLPTRVRVRGVNSRGPGEWSQPVTFYNR